jgi:hypothetical protein
MMDRYNTNIILLICPECGFEFELNSDDIDYGGNVCPGCFLPVHR